MKCALSEHQLWCPASLVNRTSEIAHRYMFLLLGQSRKNAGMQQKLQLDLTGKTYSRLIHNRIYIDAPSVWFDSSRGSVYGAQYSSSAHNNRTRVELTRFNHRITRRLSRKLRWQRIPLVEFLKSHARDQRRRGEWYKCLFALRGSYSSHCACCSETCGRLLAKFEFVIVGVCCSQACEESL